MNCLQERCLICLRRPLLKSITCCIIDDWVHCSECPATLCPPCYINAVKRKEPIALQCPYHHPYDTRSTQIYDIEDGILEEQEKKEEEKVIVKPYTCYCDGCILILFGAVLVVILVAVLVFFLLIAVLSH